MLLASPLAQINPTIHWLVIVLFVAAAGAMLLVGVAWMNRKWRK